MKYSRCGGARLRTPRKPALDDGVAMSLESFSDWSVILLYENIKQQLEADRSYKYRLTDGPLVKERAEELQNEMRRRRLPHLPIDW
jgi:hypothetical protein